MDLDRLKEIYGESILYDFKDNIDDIVDNMNYLISRGFKNVDDVFEINPYLFLSSQDMIEEKLDQLMATLGVDYIEKLENDYSLWGD